MQKTNYWDSSYKEYWIEQVKKSNENITPRAKSIPGDKVFKGLVQPYFRPGTNCLDVGCGWGRIAESAFQADVNYVGVDISKEMIAAAKNDKSNFGEFLISAAENLNFKPNTFDFVFSLGVFDCTDQSVALSEMIRVCKLGGYILFSGKNNRYRDDDHEAREAEIGARKKGEPNFFSDYANMRHQLIQNGQVIHDEKCFIRRGDFAFQDFIKFTEKEEFYEYIICIKKCSNKTHLSKFSDMYSENYLNE